MPLPPTTLRLSIHCAVTFIVFHSLSRQFQPTSPHYVLLRQPVKCPKACYFAPAPLLMYQQRTQYLTAFTHPQNTMTATAQTYNSTLQQLLNILTQARSLCAKKQCPGQSAQTWRRQHSLPPLIVQPRSHLGVQLAHPCTHPSTCCSTSCCSCQQLIFANHC